MKCGRIVKENLKIRILNIFWGALVTLAGVFLVNYSVNRDREKVIAEPEQ